MDNYDLSLVTVEDGVPVTTSLAIALGTGTDHASTIKLIRTYQTDLEEFGRVRFQIQPFWTPGGTQSREIALLNEDQATLLITYMRNNEFVRTFKIKLVKAFRALVENERNRFLTMPRSEMLTVMASMAKETEELHAKTTQQQETISVMEPKAAIHDQISNADGLHSISEAAKIVGTGQKRLFAVLRENQVLNDRNIPYQKYIDLGYFKTREKIIHMGDAGDKLYAQTFITGKGLIWIEKRWFLPIEMKIESADKNPKKALQNKVNDL